VAIVGALTGRVLVHHINQQVFALMVLTLFAGIRLLLSPCAIPQHPLPSLTVHFVDDMTRRNGAPAIRVANAQQSEQMNTNEHLTRLGCRDILFLVTCSVVFM